jgi:hypothetical protein
MPEISKPEKQEKAAQPDFFRPDESDRAARAKRWLAVARGETANLQTEPKE